MTNPTSNFGWQMPTSTDLVTDLPADFEVFGQAVDTSLADLKGGTTGQVLKKNTNTDMDFVWSADSGILPSNFTAKGDLLVGTGSGTFSAQGVGANGTVLTADSSEADGVKWAAPAGGSGDVWSFIARSSPSGSATTLSISVSGYKKILIFGRQVGTTAGGSLTIRLNANAANYNTTRNILTKNTSNAFISNYMDYLDQNGGSEVLAMDGIAGSSNNDAIYNVTVDNLNVAGFKTFESIAYYKTNSNSNENFRIEKGIWADTSTVTTINFSISGGGNLGSGGIYNLYGVVA